MCCIKIFRCGISSSLCHVLHRCLSPLAPDDFAPDCEGCPDPSIVLERPIVTPHAVPQHRPCPGGCPSRARDRPRLVAVRALARGRRPVASPRASERRRALDEFHRTPRGASHTAGDVARTGATRDARDVVGRNRMPPAVGADGGLAEDGDDNLNPGFTYTEV